MKPLVELAIPLPDVLEEVGGEYRVKGHRITLFDIVTAANEIGLEAQGMVLHYPSLSLQEIESVFEFYRANVTTVEDFCRSYQEVLDRQRAAGKQLDIEALRRRYEAMKLEANGTLRPTSTTPISS